MFSPIGNKKALLVLDRTKDPEARKVILDSLNKKPSTSTGQSHGSPTLERGASQSPLRSRSNSPTDTLTRMRARESFDEVKRSKAMQNEHLESMIQDDGPMGDAARKLMEIAIRYRPERDAAVMTAFNTCSLEPVEFRRLLGNAFRLSFTDAEFDSMVKMYKKDGIVDGSEFLVSFVKLASIKKAQIAQSIKAKNDKFLRDEKEKAERKKLAADSKFEMKIVAEVDPAVRLRALEKLKNAAKKYNKNHPSSMSLSAFETTTLTPAVFREMLKRTFNLTLDNLELSAIVKEFDENNTGNVDCSEFLLHFSRLGFLARSKERKDQRELQRKLIEDSEHEMLTKKLEADARAKIMVDMDFSEADEARMMEKLTVAAKKFDKNHPAAMGLDGFEVAALEPVEFREVCKRTFNLIFTPKEVGAVIKTFDSENTGKIPCQDFLIKFFQLGFQERNQEFKMALDRQRLANIAAKRKHEDKVRMMVEKTNFALPESYGDFDEESAMAKVRAAAVKYNKNHPSAFNLDGFEGKYLSAGVYREMMKRTFNVKLTVQELAALVKKFDSAENGTVDTTEFLKEFNRVGFVEKGKVRSEQLVRQRSLIEEAEAEAERKAREKDEKLEYNVDFEYDEEDRNSALAKMTEAATKYDKNHPSSVGLDGFMGKVVTPGMFKELLRRTFNLKLSSKELGALVQHFDKDGQGTVECSEFLNVFFKLGYEERCRWHSTQIQKQRSENEARKKAEIKKLHQVANKMEIPWDRDFSELDMASAMEKIRTSAMKYDKNHPASVGLDGFQVAYLTPGEFREMLKRTFNATMTPKEMGALLQYFNAREDGSVNTSDFLTEFMRLGYTQRQKFHKDMLVKQRSMIKEAEEEHKAKLASRWDKGGIDVEWECSEAEAESAINKLKLAAAKYDKSHPAAPGLEGFSCKNLNPTMFREMVKLTFNLKLTPPELGVIVKRYDVTGERVVDCSEFIIDFLRMGFQIRNEAAETQRLKQRDADRKAAEHAAKLLEDQANRADFEIDFNYTELERRTALKKYLDAATKYDKTNPAAMSLQSFDAISMSHGVFRESIKLTFNLTLNPAELGAIVIKYDPECKGFVPCKDFLLDFLKLGVEERNKKRLLQIDKNRAAERYQRLEAKRKLKVAEDKMELEINYEFSPEAEKSAFDKLTVAATKYDKNHPAAVPATGFDCDTMTPGVFREMAKRTFNLKLNGSELGAIFKFFGANQKKNVIVCEEFLIHFYKIGFAERNKFHAASLKMQRDANIMREKEHMEKLENQWSRLDLDVDWNYAQSDTDSALAKFTSAAKGYDPYHPAAASLKPFEGQKMIPSIFREMIKTILNLKLNNKEFGALVKYFDTDNTKQVDCADFLTKFTRIGFAEKERIRAIEREKLKKAEHRRKVESSEKIKALEDKANTFADYTFEEEDFNSALDKIRDALTGYDKYHPSAVPLDGFNTAKLTAGQFREVLKLTFGVILTSKELGAMIRYFSYAEGDGLVESELFMKHYNLIRRVVKNQAHSASIEAKKQILIKRDSERRKRAEAHEKEKVEQLHFSFKDEDSLLAKLRGAARKFAIDSASFMEPLQNIKNSTLPPVAFREVYNRVFLTKLSFSEIGALLSIIDDSGTGFVDGQTFVKMFYKLARLEEKEMFDGLTYEQSKITIETLRANQSAILLDSISSVSAPGTRAGGSHAKTAGSHSRTQGEASTQATEREIDTFTQMTLNQSWILPSVSGQAKGASRRSKLRKKNNNAEDNGNDRLSIGSDSFAPVKMKTIVPRKYQSAGTDGNPSEPVSVTFVPHGDIQVSADFSSFDFALNDTVISPPRRTAESPKRAEKTVSIVKPSKESDDHKSRDKQITNVNISSKRAGSPEDSFKPVTVAAKVEPNKNREQSKSLSESIPGMKSVKDEKFKSKDAKHADIIKSPISIPGGKSDSHNRPSSSAASPFFFPSLLGSPSAPVLTFKPVAAFGDDF